MMTTTTTILKPDQDDREYHVFTLENQLQVLLISDKNVDKSSAALDVNVGHLCDPDDVAGLAHFCEHLLFMGTEKYPVENEYSQFLSSHNGSSNAFTSGDHTNYYFDINSDYLEPILDRFAQFFVCPLFLESCTDREMHAVDSEHKKNIQSDSWRGYQLLKDLSSPNHPFNKFGTGNLETLKDIPLSKGLDIRKVLLEFHAKYYSANIMKLVILGKESIEQLKAWTIEKFSAIENKNIEVPSFPGHPFSDIELEQKILIKPVKESRNLSLFFPCKDHRKDYKVHPLQYISHLVGHEGPGSILSLLKLKGWAQALSAGVSGYGAAGFEFFKITIEMSEVGLGFMDDIVVIVFQYINMIRSLGAVSWIYKECRKINAITFKFKEKSAPSSYTSLLAGNLHIYPPEDILSGPYLMGKFDPEVINKCFDYFDVDKFQMCVQSSAVDPVGWKKAAWYGTEYSVESIGDNLKTRLRSLEPNPDLAIPEENTFIPEIFDVDQVKVEPPVVSPSIIRDTALLRLWHKKDDTFLVPKAYVCFEIKTPLAYENVRYCVLTRLYTELLKDCLAEFSYFAEVAGFSYSLENSTDGILLTAHGCNDKLLTLIKKIVQKMNTFPITESTFKRVKESLKRKMKNWFQESPHSHAMYFISLVTQEKLFTNQQKLEVIDEFTLSDVKEFYRHLLDQFCMEALVHGNVTKAEAIELTDAIITEFKTRPLPTKPLETRIYKLPPGTNIIYQKDVFNPKNVNSAIEFCVQIGSIANVKNRTYLTLISQIGQEPAFDQLRTKEQLGYMVYSGVRKQCEMISYRVIIQSERDPMFLESRIEAFLDTLLTLLINISDEKYKSHQQSLVTKLLEKHKNLYQESSRLWSHVASRYYDFEQNLTDASEIPKISKSDLIEFFKENLSMSSPTRKKVSVQMKSQIQQPMSDIDIESTSLIQKAATLLDDTDLEYFKQTLELSSVPNSIYPVDHWIK
ncbi:Metalloenzyme, LuxS/M16 peptidase-like protein [Globomyces pollinis-pini]|nr:Metalloenzyme, LuxS/M16 peptidase-like protein [Globomyces pollinis-pini]